MLIIYCNTRAELESPSSFVVPTRIRMALEPLLEPLYRSRVVSTQGADLLEKQRGFPFTRLFLMVLLEACNSYAEAVDIKYSLGQLMNSSSGAVRAIINPPLNCGCDQSLYVLTTPICRG